MRFRSLVVLAALAAVGVLGGAAGIALADDDSHRSTLFAALDGNNEVDANGNKGTGDPDGYGGAVLTFDGTTLCYGITVANIDAPVAAHVHVGKASVAGQVVLPLDAPSTGDPGAASNCAAISEALAAAIMANPVGYYVNVHTPLFPGGAVRGQLSKS